MMYSLGNNNVYITAGVSLGLGPNAVLRPYIILDSYVKVDKIKARTQEFICPVSNRYRMRVCTWSVCQMYRFNVSVLSDLPPDNCNHKLI